MLMLSNTSLVFVVLLLAKKTVIVQFRNVILILAPDLRSRTICRKSSERAVS